VNSSKLEEHVNLGSGFNVVVLDFVFISKLFTALNELNHGNFNSFLFLESLLDSQDGVFGFKVEGNF